MPAGGRRRARPSALLFLLCLVLGAALYYQIRSDRWSRLPPIASAPRPTEVTLPAPLPEFQLPPLSELAATVERPLFLPDRRPPEPADVVETVPEQAVPLHVSVTGIVLSESGRFALVRREGDTEILRMSARDTIDGWSVKQILADRVIFERDDDSLEVELKDQARPPTAPTRTRGDRRRPPSEAGQRATPSRPAPAEGAGRPAPRSDDGRSRQSNGN